MKPVSSHTPNITTDLIRIKSDFARDGFAHIGQVFSADEVAALKEGVDRVFLDERFAANRASNIVAVRMFETGEIFEELLTREPLITWMEDILGESCHLISQNAVRNAPGQAIDFFHVDDQVYLPLSGGRTRHDADLEMPIHICTIQLPLTDIPSAEYGATEYVPGSHYSGREPNDRLTPDFEGKEPVPVLCKAGEGYLHNGQCWHRGRSNTSTQTRVLLQLSFAMRWVSQRFYPFLNYHCPEDIIERADARRKRVLGLHETGAYG